MYVKKDIILYLLTNLRPGTMQRSSPPQWPTPLFHFSLTEGSMGCSLEIMMTTSVISNLWKKHLNVSWDHRHNTHTHPGRLFMISPIETTNLHYKTAPKLHFMVFHRGKRKIDVNNPSLNNIALKKVNYSKFLGVIIENGRHVWCRGKASDFVI